MSSTAAAAVASSGSNGSPATAAPRSKRRDSSREERELLRQRGGDQRRYIESVSESSGWSIARAELATGRPAELLEVEGVSTALFVQGDSGRLVDGCAE